MTSSVAGNAANRCHEEGWLVAGKFAVPDAAYDYAWGRAMVGCNQLHCRRCGSRVRSQAGLVPGRAVLAPADLYAQNDWQSLADGNILMTDSDARLYVCACNMHVQGSLYRSIADPGGENDLDPLPPGWHCAGHPTLGIPTNLDGISVDDHTDFATWVRSSLAGQSIAQPPAFVGQYRSCECERLYYLLRHTRLTDTVSRAVATALGDADPGVRVGAAEFFESAPGAAGGEALARAVLTDASAWRGVQNPFRKRRTLADALSRALAQRLIVAPKDVELQRAIQAIALWPERTAPQLLDALVLQDPRWLAQHAADMLAATPNGRVLGDLLYVLGPVLGAAIEAPALAMWRTGAVDAPTFRDVVEQLLEEPVRGRVLAAM